LAKTQAVSYLRNRGRRDNVVGCACGAGNELKREESRVTKKSLGQRDAGAHFVQSWSESFETEYALFS